MCLLCRFCYMCVLRWREKTGVKGGGGCFGWVEGGGEKKRGLLLLPPAPGAHSGLTTAHPFAGRALQLRGNLVVLPPQIHAQCGGMCVATVLNFDPRPCSAFWQTDSRKDPRNVTIRLGSSNRWERRHHLKCRQTGAEVLDIFIFSLRVKMILDKWALLYVPKGSLPMSWSPAAAQRTLEQTYGPLILSSTSFLCIHPPTLEIIFANFEEWK